MKKVMKLLLVAMMCLGLTACGGNDKTVEAETIDDVEKIANDNNLKDDGFDSIGLFWKFSFADMDFSVGFDIEEKPKDYYIDNKLSMSDIKYIEVKPDKDIGSQWIYLKPQNGEFKVDEDDIEAYNDKGRKEGYEGYQEKFGELGLTAKLFGEWTVRYFNENTRPNLVKAAQKEADELLEKMKASGFNYEKDDKGRQIITSQDPYKIVIVNKQCTVLGAGFDLSTKTGYMYIPEQDICGYNVNGQSLFIYRYSDNAILQGSPSLTQYTEMIKIKNWYDDLLTKLSTSTEVIQRIK